jgi:hypothetical protein
VRFYIGITDSDWFEYLFGVAHLDEVNFWQPQVEDASSARYSSASVALHFEYRFRDSLFLHVHLVELLDSDILSDCCHSRGAETYACRPRGSVACEFTAPRVQIVWCSSDENWIGDNPGHTHRQ